MLGYKFDQYQDIEIETDRDIRNLISNYTDRDQINSKSDKLLIRYRLHRSRKRNDLINSNILSLLDGRPLLVAYYIQPFQPNSSFPQGSIFLNGKLIKKF